MNLRHLQSPSDNKGKCNNSLAEYERFKSFLSVNTATCSMVCNKLGIPQKNATRYKRDLEEKHELLELFINTCQITGFKAAYLTTNPSIIQSVLRENKKQLKLFEDE